MSLLPVQAGKNIAVAGAGLGGLAFALALLQFSKQQRVHPLPHIHVFERDASPDARAGFGYSLGVRSDSGGLQVHIPVEFCNRYQAILSSSRPEAARPQAFHVLCLPHSIGDLQS